MVPANRLGMNGAGWEREEGRRLFLANVYQFTGDIFVCLCLEKWPTKLQERNISNLIFVISHIIFSNTHNNPCKFIINLILQMRKLEKLIHKDYM